MNDNICPSCNHEISEHADASIVGMDYVCVHAIQTEDGMFKICGCELR